jgi:transcription elongation factor Elf1
MERSESLTKLINDILRSKIKPADIYKCEHCNGSVHVKFEVYSRGKRTMLGIIASCDTCGNSLALDLEATKIPQWLREEKRES